MEASWPYVKRLAQRSEQIGFDVTLIAELNLNDIKGVEANVLEPKPVAKPRPCIYAGGESPAAKDLIAEKCDAYLMHGDPPERVAEKIADLRARRAKHANLPPMKFGVAGYAVVRESEQE